MSELNEFKAKVLPCLLMLCSLIMVCGAASATESTQEFGRVSMQGSIINTPCSIATADLNQTIEMKVTTVGEVIDNGFGQSNRFSIMLVNCSLDSSSSHESYFSTAFDGASEDGLFMVNGAAGVGLQMSDIVGNIAQPGKPLPAGILKRGSQHLDYTLRLVRNHAPFKTGTYNAVLRFKTDYL